MLAIQQEHASVCSFLLSVGNNLVFLSSSVKKEEEDLEDKKSIKKRIKELKVLDPKIAQNLCKYLFPFSPLLLPRIGFKYCTRMCLGHVCHSNRHSSSQDTLCWFFPWFHILKSHPVSLYYLFFACYKVFAITIIGREWVTHFACWVLTVSKARLHLIWTWPLLPVIHVFTHT